MLDEHIGVVDCPWLGMTPKVIDSIMITTCTELDQFIPHAETRESISNNLNHSWREIKTLIMGRAIGLHRIISSSGKDIEKQWRKDFQIDINSFRKLKKDSTPQCIPSLTRAKRKFDITDATNSKILSSKRRKVSTIVQNQVDLKLCTGITCNDKYESWYINNNFSPNRIKTSIKQCQRCGRYMTSFRQSKHLLSEIAISPMHKPITNLLNFVKENQISIKHKYKNFAHLLNACLQPSTKEKLIPITTSRIQDRFKLISNIICVSILKASNNFNTVHQNLIQTSITILDRVLACKESDFTLNLEAETKIRLLINHNNIPCMGVAQRNSTATIEPQHKIVHNTDTCNSLPVTPTIPAISLAAINDDHIESPNKKLFPIRSGKKGNRIINPEVKPLGNINQENAILRTMIPSQNLPTKISKHPLISAVTFIHTQVRINSSQTGKKGINIGTAPEIKLKKKAKLRHFASNIIRPHICLSGDEMMKAVEVLRSFKVPNLYIASAEASNQIESWKLTQTWTHFAKMFGSRDLIENKLHGTYLIPLFSGATRAGHWYLCIIQKIGRRFMKGWCMDSLGKGSIGRNIIHKIEMAFAPGRAKLKWQSCQ